MTAGSSFIRRTSSILLILLLQLWQTGNDVLAFRWVLVHVAISAVFLLTVNLLEDRQRREGRR